MTGPDAPLRYRAVLFDLDGTLVDSYSALSEAVNFARRQHGLKPLGETRIKQFVGDGLDKLLQRAFETSDVPGGVQEAFESRYDEICCAESKILEDVEATLDQLASKGVAMAVCTNKPTFFSRKILEALGLARHFRAIVGPDLAGARKPDARHLLRALDATGVAIADALFVGDMPIDVQAARNSGIDAAVVPTGSSSTDQLREAHADHYLARFSDLVQIVTEAQS
ncbi:MAG TPA: HAD-IA family hydrolase [Thermoanaerobaculia bacterium]|jgi:phosphoglycolate phosphatase|nr:HAD-IA family hydrolase [Thermoanaerobaculia bacterium]